MAEDKGIQQGCFWREEEMTDPLQSAERLLGKAGRKQYVSMRAQRPTTILDASIFDIESRKIWSGDIEIERNWKALLKLSTRIGPLHILSDEDRSFLEERSLISEIRKRASVIVEFGRILYSKNFALKVRFRRGKMNSHGVKK